MMNIHLVFNYVKCSDRKSEGEWILTVHQTCIQDTGDYKVVAKNQGGEASSVSRVVVGLYICY